MENRMPKMSTLLRCVALVTAACFLSCRDSSQEAVDSLSLASGSTDVTRPFVTFRQETLTLTELDTATPPPIVVGSTL